MESPSSDPYENAFGKVVVLLLNLIGVTDKPPPPSAGPEEVEASDLSGVWRDGAIAPSTFRSLAGVLLRGLPPESRRAVGELLVKSASPEHAEPLQEYDLLSDFSRRDDPWLDQIPAVPMVGINLDAPVRTVVGSVERWVKELKARHESQGRGDDGHPYAS